MTEQEIINTLKENKTKGIAYLFLSEEVWEWIGENFRDPKLMYLAPNGKWEPFSETDFDDYDNVVFALPDYYKVKQELSGEWVEFEIEDFCFAYSHSVGTSHLFDWFDWGFFLKASKKQGWGFTAFGGWQYESNGYWLTEPHVIGKEVLLTTLTDYNEDCKPAIPKKIRFWREA